MYRLLPLLFIWSYSTFAQNTWVQKNDFAGTQRDDGVSFSINGIGYFGTGMDAGFQLNNDLWEYNPANDAWTQKASLPAAPRQYAVGFSLNGRGYIATGIDNTGNYCNDVWE